MCTVCYTTCIYHNEKKSRLNDNLSQTDSFFGRTPRYAAPEVASDDKHGRAADIFSMGCVLAEMNSVFTEFSILEFDTFRQRAMNIPPGVRRASPETTPSVPYNQTVERPQEWIRALDQMDVDPENISSMLDKDPSGGRRSSLKIRIHSTALQAARRRLQMLRLLPKLVAL